jgi:hypothetical protein
MPFKSHFVTSANLLKRRLSILTMWRQVLVVMTLLIQGNRGRSAKMRLSVGLSAAIVVLLNSAVFGFSDKDIWLSAKRGEADLQRLVKPNVAIGIPANQMRAYLAKLLTFEAKLFDFNGVSSINFKTEAANIALQSQSIGGNSDFAILLPKTTTGLPIDISVWGSTTFTVSLTFSGMAFQYLPRIEDVNINGVSVPLPDPIKAQIPKWIQDAIISYLQNHNLLQLPVQLFREIPLSSDALSTGSIPASAVTINKAVATAEFWISAASVLIDGFGVLGIADIKYDLTMPSCSSLMREAPSAAELRFTQYGTDQQIIEIGPKDDVVTLKGKLNPSGVSYQIYWRFNGVTVSANPVPIDHRTGNFELPLAVLPASSGLYTAVVVYSAKVDGSDRQCMISSSSIVRPAYDDPTIPDPLSHAEAMAEFANYAKAFEVLAGIGGLAVRPGDLYLSLAKSEVAGIFSQTVTGLGISGSVDASKIPKIVLDPADLKVPELDPIDCKPTKKCDPTRKCLLKICFYDEDQRECGRHTPFGDVNDPICEGEKALENQGRFAKALKCQAEAALALADCERLVIQEKTTCELEKTTEKALCENIKQDIKSIRAVMFPDSKIADVNADFLFTGAATFNIVNLNIDANLASFQANLRYGANLHTDAHISFRPINVLGHQVTCISTWDAPISLNVAAPIDSHVVTGAMEIEPSDHKLSVQVEVPSLSVHFAPAPFVALFAQNPGLVMLCPMLFTAGVGDGLYTLLDQKYKGTLWTGDHTFDPFKFKLVADIPGINIPPQYGWPSLNLQIYNDKSALTWR